MSAWSTSRAPPGGLRRHGQLLRPRRQDALDAADRGGGQVAKGSRGCRYPAVARIRRGPRSRVPHRGTAPSWAATWTAASHGFLLTEIAGRWARESGPRIFDSFDSVSSVSCASPGNCGAVGVTAGLPTAPRTGFCSTAPPTPCVVPRLKGMTVPRARHSIDSHNCSVGTIAHVRSRTVEAGHVISQTPQPGRHLAPGTKINLKVSSGP